MKKHYPLMLAAFGILLIVAGVGYGVFFAGIPGPDDSPAEAARVSMHGNLAFGGVCVGVLCFLVGVVVGLIRLLSRKPQRQA
jgi:hypothetical protein